MQPPQEARQPTSSTKPKSDKLPSEKMLDNLIEKRNAYLRTVFREGENIYEIQSRFIEYEHQVRKTSNNMDTLFTVQVPPGKELANENAIVAIYYDLEIWDLIQKYNKEKGLANFENLESTPIETIREDMKQIIMAKIPDDANKLMKQEKLLERGKSQLGEENIPKSFLQDKSFVRKRDQIKSLKQKNLVISKKNQEEEIPKINVRPSPEEDSIREDKEEIHKIGEDDGEEVSHINVEEDSEIEYNLENINGRKKCYLIRRKPNFGKN